MASPLQQLKSQPDLAIENQSIPTLEVKTGEQGVCEGCAAARANACEQVFGYL